MDLNSPDQGIVSKAEFARLANVSGARVSQWLRTARISGDAVVGEGHYARIKVPVALAQLKRRLDPVQRVANGLDTNLRLRAEPPASSSDDVVDGEIKLGRLEAIRLANRRAAEAEALRAGKYVLAADVETQMGRIAGEMMAAFEGSLSELATAIAAKFNLVHRDVLHQLRIEFCKIRERTAAGKREAAGALPAVIEVQDASG